MCWTDVALKYILAERGILYLVNEQTYKTKVVLFITI